MANSSNKANHGRVYAIIAAAVIILLLIIIFRSPTTNNTDQADALAPQKLINQITSVPTSVSDSIGSGTSTTKASTISAKSYLTSKGLPQILYMGAEYCPYCATERWPMIIALSKFGTFSDIHTTHSSTTDVYPDTQTFSFHGSSFVSKYIGFTPVEMFSNIADSSASSGYTTLDTPTAAQQSLMSTYDAPPYVSSSDQGAIPFIYFGGKYLIVGASYSPQVLQGKSYQQIANSLSSPSSAIAKGMLGAANNITATICKLTNNQPTTACTPTIMGLESSL